jgi:hypothetical protein
MKTDTSLLQAALLGYQSRHAEILNAMADIERHSGDEPLLHPLNKRDAGNADRFLPLRENELRWHRESAGQNTTRSRRRRTELSQEVGKWRCAGILD